MFNIGTEMYGAGSNIGSRAETTQVSNVDANRYWYTETVYSSNRDRTLFPDPSKYVVPLSRNYKRVLEVELLSAQISLSPYLIECRDEKLQNTGNNSLRFNEGYIVDDGSLYGIKNNRVMVREYTDGSLITPPKAPLSGRQGATAVMPTPFCADPICPPEVSVSSVELPRTLTHIQEIAPYSTVPDGCSSVQCVKITTACNHNFTCKWAPVIYVVDALSKSFENVNGQYQVTEILDQKSFLAVPSKHCQVPDLTLNPTDTPLETGGWIYLPRIQTPHDLAEMVQDYLNQCACPPVRNQYSVTFDDCLGRFVFTRAFGIQLFDLLAGSDDRSILSETMGFSRVDYFYGQYDHLTSGQNRLPSEALCDAIRPDIQSQTVGESALVSVSRGNYTAGTLADTITMEMQRPLIEKDKNDLLTVQLMGQVVDICVPCGMYDPQSLLDVITWKMTDAYYCIKPGGDDEKFTGDYCLKTGSFHIDSTIGEPFGLLFTRSTIGALLGFEQIDLTGDCAYSSMNSIFFPVTNCRYTDQVYSVTPHLKDSTFRFTKCGAFQAPIVSVEPSEHSEHRVRISTYTEECGGCAHGFQVGDIMTIEGQDVIQTEPKFVGVHVVQEVIDAFSFELCLKIVGGDDAQCLQTDTDCDQCHSKKDQARQEGASCEDHSRRRAGQRRVRRTCGGGAKIRADEGCSWGVGTEKQFAYVASHWFQPFSLFFPGVTDPINQVLGFTKCVSGCVDYVSPNQWDLSRQRDVYINIQELCNTDNGRICKTSDSGCNSKYSFNVLNSFVRIPLSQASQEAIEFGLLSSSSYYRKHRYTLNSKDLYEVSVSLVDSCGNLIDFHGRDHSFDLRILIEQ